MIVGIGIDAVQISRMEKWAGDPLLLNRYFDTRELDVIRPGNSQAAGLQKPGKGMVRSLAAHFAAKEAFAKALGTGFAGLVLRDIMVLKDQKERPFLCLKKSARKAMKAAGAERVHISLTHEGNMAFASVILET